MSLAVSFAIHFLYGTFVILRSSCGLARDKAGVGTPGLGG